MTDTNPYAHDPRTIATIIKEDIAPFLRHIYPEYKQHDESTMGGKIMNYLDKVFPWDTT